MTEISRAAQADLLAETDELLDASTRVSAQLALQMYRDMVRIRTFELAVERLFLDGEIPGFVHLSVGQEAVAVGVCSALNRDDYLTTSHRGHGHALAKGASPAAMMAELQGRSTGTCHGYGGSMHIADFSVGMLGANAIVAGGIGIAVGAALSLQLRESSGVAVSIFGDGAVARGPFHECLNLAAVWKLPVVFVCENNGWASTTSIDEALAVPKVAERAALYGMHGVEADGNNVFEVYRVVSEAVHRARQKQGPTLVEARTYRIRGHFVGDPMTYRRPEELLLWEKRDPIKLAGEILGQFAVLDADFDRIAREAKEEIASAIAFAQHSPAPEPDQLHAFLYAD